MALKKVYAYDGHGNKIKEIISGKGIQTAQTLFAYDAQGKFQTKVTNATGLSETKTYDARFGAVKTLTGPNGLTTTWTYDGMGRKIYEKRADGTWSKWEHLWCGNGTINNRYVYWLKQTQSGSSYDTQTFYDSLGRETAKHTSALGGKRILRYKFYNAKGELYRETLPYIYNQESQQFIDTTYDKYGRAIRLSKPGPNGTRQVFRTSYSNFTTITTNPKGIQKQTVQNAIGKTISITDAYGTGAASSIHYSYDAIGHLLTTKDSAGNVITMYYDVAGNKTYMSDPDLGTWYYAYNALGKMTSRSNIQHQGTAIGYDVLGRIQFKSVWENTNTHYQSFTYGGASAPVGSRGKRIETYASSTLNGADWHAQKISTTYDTLGRPTSSNTYIYGRSSYLSSTTYDAYSRPSIVTYPNGYKITYHYANGILDYIQGSDGKIHYTIQDVNAFGRESRAKYANGVIQATGYDGAGYAKAISAYNRLGVTVQSLTYGYDSLGNVVSREDTGMGASKSIYETYSYDVMDRLINTQVNSNVLGNYRKNINYEYDKLGNMMYQTGIGYYSYYADKPHAVKSAGTKTYSYDALGNMVNRNGDTITYNPLNKPAVLKNHQSAEVVKFYYGVGGKRYLKTTSTKETLYLGKTYEEERTYNSSEIKSTIYLTIGGKTIGTHVEIVNSVYSINKNNPNYKRTYNRYFHTDALGSIAVITDDAGKVVERRSYEPFGKIRAMDYGLTSNHAIIPTNTVLETARAFTGHEQIAELSGLIHMNARIYDSDIGRFLSADTVIQNPYDSQAYNRYSYVRNNPLKYVDPSGHSWLSSIGRWIDKHILQPIKNSAVGRLVVGAVLVVAGVLLAPYTYGASLGLTSLGGSLINYDPSEPAGPNNQIGGTIGVHIPIGGGGGKSPDDQREHIDEIKTRTHSGVEPTSAAPVTNDNYANGAATDSYGNMGGDISIVDGQYDYTPSSPSDISNRINQLDVKVLELRNSPYLSSGLHNAFNNGKYRYVDDPRKIFNDGQYYSGGKHTNGWVDISPLAFGESNGEHDIGMSLALSPDDHLTVVLIHETLHYGTYHYDMDPQTYDGLLGPRNGDLASGKGHENNYYLRVRREFIMYDTGKNGLI